MATIDSFEVGETVICTSTITDADGVATDPDTSINIVVERIYPTYASLVSSTAMTKSGVGVYYYDIATTSYIEGEYLVTVTATDSARVTKRQDKFKMVRSL